MRGRGSWVVALALAVAGLAAWRAACVLGGPDIDTDAYAHHMIARAILADPGDLAVHWVWLPLFHYLQVPLVALGGTLDTVRWANVALTALLPVALFGYVRMTGRRRADDAPSRLAPEFVALLAALFTATCPIVMQMGTTAQPEPLFALLVLGVAMAFQQRRHGAAAAMLGAAVLLRYEAWASLAVIGAFIFAERGRTWLDRWKGRKAPPSAPESAGSWIVMAAPVTLILAWAALRRPVDGRWFGFLGDTHQFASQVMTGRRDTWLAWIPSDPVRDLLYYPVFVAWRVMGPALPLAVFGVRRAIREQGVRFVGVLAACLGFISLTWLKRSSLGLDRHFVVVVPLYATFAAQGVAVLSDAAARFARGHLGERAAATAGRASAWSLSVVSIAAMCIMLRVWMGFWQASIERGWPERAKLAAFLESLPGTATIFCDDATLELLSTVDRRRFDRHWLDDPQTWNLVDEVARERGGAYVATWRRKLSGHERAGEVVFHAGDSADDPLSGVEVMRIGPDGGHAAR